MVAAPLSVVAGPPLSDEAGIGALTLGGWLRENCERFGPREALVFYDNGRRISWTYDDLWERVNEVARALVACGVGKGTRVGVLMTNRPEFVSAVFGTALAGGAAATLSTFSTAAELDHLVRASAASVLLIERHVLKKDFAEMLGDLDAYPYLTHVAAIGGGAAPIEDWDAFLARGATVPQTRINTRAAEVQPADPGVIFFSSGSTAKPKGVLSAHRGVTLQLWRWPHWFQSGDDARIWSANGFFWSGNFSMALGGALSNGGALVLQSTFQPEEALALMAAERATQVLAWPHQWQQLIGAPNWATVDLSAWKYVDAQSPLAAHPTARLDWREPAATFGNTEMFTVSSTFPANTPDKDIGGSHGRPCPGNVFKIVDPLTGATVPMGTRGEICVKGPTLMLGYLGIALSDTLDAEGFLRTGDGGWFDPERRLHWEGRLNDIVKTGGANVSPLEIDALLATMPGVKTVQTVGVPHETLGELVVACIVPHDGATLDEAAVQAFAKQALASYKVPRRVLLFAEDDLALTGSAKIKTADLRVLAAKRLEGDT